MICETCHGAGYLPARLLDNQRRGAWVKLPCLDCGGSGVAHCCDGLQEQEAAPDQGKPEAAGVSTG